MAKLTDRPPTPTPGSPFLPPPPKPQLPPADPDIQQRAVAALILAVLGIVSIMLISNWQRAGYALAVASIVALAGFVLAISAMRAAKRAGTRRPRASVAAAVLGGLCTVFAGLAAISFLLFGAQLAQYVNCMNAAASSTAAQNACQTALENAITARLGGQ